MVEGTAVGWVAAPDFELEDTTPMSAARRATPTSAPTMSFLSRGRGSDWDADASKLVFAFSSVSAPLPDARGEVRFGDVITKRFALESSEIDGLRSLGWLSESGMLRALAQSSICSSSSATLANRI